jgi:hypothetical protein
LEYDSKSRRLKLGNLYYSTSRGKPINEVIFMTIRKFMMTFLAVSLLTMSSFAAPWSGSGTYTVGSGGDYATLSDFFFAMTGFRQAPGTITGTAGSPTITGVGTSFTTQFAVGDIIHRQLAYTVQSIESDTALTLTSNVVTAFATSRFGQQQGVAPTAINGNVVVEIISNITETVSGNIFVDTAGYTLTIKPAASNPAPVTITYPNHTGGTEWSGSLVIGANNFSTTLQPKKVDNLIIDGSKDGLGNRDLTITQGGTSAGNVVVVVGDCDNLIFKNVSIISTGGGTYALRICGAGWEGTPQLNLLPENGLIENCYISQTTAAAGQAISNENSVVTGHVAVQSTYAQSGWVIRNNDLFARTRGIFMNATAGITIENNRITINQTGGGYASYGIWHLSANAANNFTQTIRNNRIVTFNHAVASGNFGPLGIALQGAGAAAVGVRYDVYNNMVGGFNMTAAAATNVYYKGIMVANNVPTYNIINNSVYMPDFANLTGQLSDRSYGIGAEASPAMLRIKNNIIYHGEAGGACITKTGASGVLESDYNVFCNGGAANFGRLGSTNHATLAAWQGATGGDANSVELDPSTLWVSNSDLHFASAPGAAWKAGADVSTFPGLDKDFDGGNRDVVQPYFGADEPVAPNTTLTIVSANGSPVPAVGVQNTTSGTLVNASVASPVAGAAGTRYVCTGFTGTGSAPASGIESFVTFEIKEPASITWNWKTQYQLTTAVAPAAGGTVSGADWYDADASAPVEATENTFYTFTGWSGDLSGAVNPTNVTMDAPKAVTANFSTPALNVPVVAKNFGGKLVTSAGGASEDFDFAIQNVGSPALDVNIYKESGSADFAIVPPAPATIAAGTTETLKVRYTPDTIGVVNATFKVVTQNSATPSTFTLTVSGTGINLTAVVGASAALGAWTPALAPTMNDAGVDGDAAAADGIYTLEADLGTTPSVWKVLKNKNLGWGGGNDVGRQADGGDMPDGDTTGTVTYFYDTRDLTADGWMPATEGLGSTALSNIPWVAVGSFQAAAGGSNWDADSAVTAMRDDGLNGDAVAGDGIFTFQFQPTVELVNAEWLVISNLGSGWGGEYKFGSNGMAQDPGGVTQPQFSADRAKEITMEYDAWLGHIRLTMVTKPPLAVNDWAMY